jgi:MFS family permease
MVASALPQDTSKMNTPLAWVVCFSASLFFFYSFIQMMMFNAVSPMLFKEFHANAAQIGGLASSYFYGNVPCLLIAGLILDRFSTRKVLLSAILVAVLGTFIFAFSTHIWMAAIGRFLVGCACAFCFLGIIRLVSRWFTPNHMALIIGLVVTVAFLGGMVAQTPLALLTKHFNWRVTMSIDGVLGIIILLLVSIFVKDTPDKEAVKAQQAELKNIGFWHTIFKAITNLQNWCGGIFASATNFPVFILGATFGSLYLTQISHDTTIEAGNLMVVFFLGLMIGSPLFGFISDKLRNRKMPMLFAAVLLLVTVLAMMYWAHMSAFWMGVTLFLMGFASGGQVIGFPLIAESNSPALTATAESLGSALIMTGGFTQSFVGRLLQDDWGHKMHGQIPVYSWHDFQSAFLIMPIAAVVAIIAVLLTKETHAKNICS